MRIDALLVRAEIADLVVGQELQLGDADAVLARNHAVERTRELHDALDRVMRVLQHLVVVGVDRDVRVHVAVARMHVQRDEHAAAQHALVDRLRFVEDRLELAAVEDLPQFRANLLLPRHADRAVLRDVEDGRVRLRVDAVGELLRKRFVAELDEIVLRLAQRHVELVARRTSSACARAVSSIERLLHAIFEQLGAGDFVRVVALAERQLAGLKNASSASTSCSLFLIDSSMLMRSMPSVYSPMRSSGITTSSLILNALVCLAIAAVRAAVEPEALARLGVHRDEAFAALAVGHAHDFRGGGGDRIGVVADDVADQHHLRERVALGLGRIADRAQIALVEMLETGEERAALRSTFRTDSP